jgi:hypothetical protein
LSPFNRLLLAIQSMRELGFEQPFLNALYRLSLKTGYLRWRTPAQENPISKTLAIQPFLTLPSQAELKAFVGDNASQVFSAADELIRGQVQLFGGPPQPLTLEPHGSLLHWTIYENKPSLLGTEDIKFTWEPARFGWAYLLARAYLLSGSENYAQLFWQLAERFLDANPLNRGPNWTSGQEVALRLMAFTFAIQAFSGSPHSTILRQNHLIQAIYDHAARIPPTLIYARSQNNNHLISEAIGLYTAGTVLADLPEAPHWRSLGWRWLNHALQSQIAPDGTYIQHSANYHRLMLQAALWADALRKHNQGIFPPETSHKLASATRWLLALLDPISGQVPNLGHNDGAYILPLAPGRYTDYRPVLQAAACAFLGQPCLPPGPWDEMSLWFGVESRQLLPNSSQLSANSDQPSADNDQLLPNNDPKSSNQNPQSTIRNSCSWGYLRAAHFTNRPGHADQLHVDLWWQGYDIALDAGTYQYNASPPWENSLAGSAVHNTILVDDQDQMQRAGRFLWLHWAQARQLDADPRNHTLVAEHTGYKRLGVLHRRSLVQIDPLHWKIVDDLLPDHPKQRPHHFTLHWLLPDWPFTLDDSTIHLQAPCGTITLAISWSGENLPAKMESVQLIRAGKLVSGALNYSTILGWYSPTYAMKVPALSFRVNLEGTAPLRLQSDWDLTPSSPGAP